MSTTLILLSILKLSTAGLYENCVECFEGICCDDPITDIDTLICKHWTSSSGSFGAPLDICFGRFGGAESTSVSQMYKCSEDGSTVNLYDYTGCSDCNCAPTLRTDFNAIFNPQMYPDRDTFNCSGPPCPYYIIEDGTAHPSGQCPFDVGKGGVAGGNYATWHVKLILEGCQSFGGTSTLLMCDSQNGILQMNFGNDRCSFDPNNGGGNTDNKTLDGGAVECNKQFTGTGRSVYCSEETTTTSASITTTTAPITTTSASATSTAAATTTSSNGVTTTGVATTAASNAATTTSSGGTTASGSGTTASGTTAGATSTGSGATTGSGSASTASGTTAGATTTSSGGNTGSGTTSDGATTKAGTTSAGNTKASKYDAGTTGGGSDSDTTRSVNMNSDEVGRRYGYHAGFGMLVMFGWFLLN